MALWKAAVDGPEKWDELSGFWPDQVVHESALDPFLIIGKKGIESLQQISAAEKARAVPYLVIQQVNRETNEAVGQALNYKTLEPPAFGKSISGNRFGERPPASIKSVTVKTVNPTGLILYREIDIAITVHRPDIIFKIGTPETESISALLTPGTTHILKYGWIGGTGAILQGGRRSGETNRSVREPDEWVSHGSNLFVARTAIRFAVVNYNFSIQPDGQIELSIHGMEDGELHVRNAVFLDQADTAGAPTLDDLKTKIIERMKEKAVRSSFTAEITIGDGSPTTLTRDFVKFKDVFDTLTAYPLTNSFKKLGYSTVDLYMGVINKTCPDCSPLYASARGANMPIAEFQLPLEEVTKVVDTIISTKEQITVYNVIRRLIAVLHDPQTWKNMGAGVEVSVPEIQMRTLYDPEAKRATVWLVDMKRYLTNLQNANVNEHNVTSEMKKWTKERLSRVLSSNDIPRVVFGHANSFIQTAKFDVTNDELMKSIFIGRAFKPTRENLVGGSVPANEAGGTIDSRYLLYRSAIRGSVTMFGNFVFDVFGIVYLDFGIKAWDGFFFVREKVDRIDASGFTTTVDLVAEGSNPMGNPVAMPATTADDWFKDHRDSELAYQAWMESMGVAPEPTMSPAKLPDDRIDLNPPKPLYNLGVVPLPPPKRS